MSVRPSSQNPLALAMGRFSDQVRAARRTEVGWITVTSISGIVTQEMVVYCALRCYNKHRR